MTRATSVAATLGGALVFAPIAASAQSGDAIANAEQACLDTGVRPYGTSFNVCVDRAAVAFDRGSHESAFIQARAVRQARDTCASYGVSPATLGYRDCLNTEADRRTDRAYGAYYTPPAAPRYGYVIHRDPDVGSP